MSLVFSRPINSMNFEAQSSAYDLLSNITKSLSFTSFTRFRSYEMYNQLKLRIDFLESFADDFRLELAKSPILSIDEQFIASVQSLHDDLQLAYDVRAQLDINNTIDHEPIGDDAFLSKYGKKPSTVWRNYINENPEYKLRQLFAKPKFRAKQDEVSDFVREMGLNSRRSFTLQRLMRELDQAHSDGWYVIFDTLTLANDRLESFYSNETALRDYFRDVGREILKAERRKTSESYSDCYKYFCVPEFGSENGRLHFHALHLCRTLPLDSVDPNFGRFRRNYRQIKAFSGLWHYGFSKPIAVRYTGDAFGNAGWLWPVDQNNKPIPSKPVSAVGFYIAKYVNKNYDERSLDRSYDLCNTQTHMKLYRVRMSRGFGMTVPTMSQLTYQDLLSMLNLQYESVKNYSVLKQNLKKELRLRLAMLCIDDILEVKPAETFNLLKYLRDSILKTPQSKLLNFIAILTQKLAITDISNEAFRYLASSGFLRDSSETSASLTFAKK